MSPWRLAEDFGATCGATPGPDTTHVVAVNWGTEKTAWARENGRQGAHTRPLFSSTSAVPDIKYTVYNPS